MSILKIPKTILTMKNIKILFCTALLLCLLSLPSYAATLNLFSSDYDNDKWQVEEIVFTQEDIIPIEWYPLRAASECLPIDVSWDDATREIVVYSHEMAKINAFIAEQRYHADNIPASKLKIKDGVTYCSPEFLSKLLPKTGFVYDNEVYCFNGETVSSKLIKHDDSYTFKASAITSMYELKLKLPENYAFVRKYLTGGISLVKVGTHRNVLSYAAAYVFPKANKPDAYIISNSTHPLYDFEPYVKYLTKLICHEAYHVYLERIGKQSETDAMKYGREIYHNLQY